MFVVSAEERLLANSPDVLALFAGNPFADNAPKFVRAVIWRYWFTSLAEKRASGLWWHREELGLYAARVDSFARWQARCRRVADFLGAAPMRRSDDCFQVGDL